ncbi:unnamed protein product, partial [Dicrocoelium dendriticum]
MNAFKSYIPNARGIICRFHVLRDMRKRCAHLKGCNAIDRRKVAQWLSKLMYTQSKLPFNKLFAAIGARSKEAFRYLNSMWLPYTENWAGHILKGIRNLGNFITNRVEIENRHLKHGLSRRSSVIQLFKRCYDRIKNWTRQGKA